LAADCGTHSGGGAGRRIREELKSTGMLNNEITLKLIGLMKILISIF